MNWDWEKLQSQRRRGQGLTPPDLGDMGEQFRRLRPPGGYKVLLPVFVLFWVLGGFYIVQPDEVGVVRRFGVFDRITDPGPHLHWPWPVESVITPKVSEVRRVEVGQRSMGRTPLTDVGQSRPVPEESLMLTGDENIVDVQFIVQYQIKDPVAFLFNVANQAETVKNVAEAAMREVVGKSQVDAVLTTGKTEIQAATQDLMQEVLDRYKAGVRIMAVQLQDVHPPKDVVEAFKDVASAREDKSRFINEADAYRNDILPRARGQAATIFNEARAFKDSQVLAAKGGVDRFKRMEAEYRKAPELTRKRMYIESMEKIFSNPELEKTLMPAQTAGKLLPYLPLGQSQPRVPLQGAAPQAKTPKAGQ